MAFLLLQRREVDLSESRKLERLRLVNVTPSKLFLWPECKIAVKQWGSSATASPICTQPDYDVQTATWVLRENM